MHADEQILYPFTIPLTTLIVETQLKEGKPSLKPLGSAVF